MKQKVGCLIKNKVSFSKSCFWDIFDERLNVKSG